jgi:hypothetical protein
MIERWFNQAGEIWRASRTPDGAGGHMEEWIAIMTSRGKLDMLSGTERIYGNKVSTEATHIWICSPFTTLISEQEATMFGLPFAPSPYGEAVPLALTSRDRLVVDGKRYEMLYIDDPMHLGKHLEIYLKEADYV